MQIASPGKSNPFNNEWFLSKAERKEKELEHCSAKMP